MYYTSVHVVQDESARTRAGASQTRWERLKALVADAAELPTQERAAFLVRECASDHDLLSEARKLLANLESGSGSEIIPRELPKNALRPNDVLDSRFRIDGFLGAGGMGEVYQATDLELGGQVAVKVLRAEMSANTEYAARFRREVQIARKVTHPNICRIFDVGNDRGLIFLTMELLGGETLAQLLRRTGKLSCEQALPLLRQIAAGLDALHSHGIVHRDFKPGNVMIDSAGRAVVNDFGLARTVALDESVDRLSKTGQVIGTPAYMSPEQLMGGAEQIATDIYAFGLVIYEMVTGTRAYPGGGAIENAVQRVVEAPARPQNVPLTWETTIMQCLERDPARRPQSAGSVIAMLSGEPGADQAWGSLRIRQSLGSDGYLAVDPTLGKEFALQLVPTSEADTQTQLQTLIREVQARTRVRHPNLISIYGVDQHDGKVGYWSDYVQGKSLADWLRLQGPFSPRETAAIGTDLAKAVQSIHAAGLTHGGIALSNIVRGDGGLIRLGFGHPSSNLSSKTIADDICAIGGVLFELLTGSLHTEGKRTSAFRPDVPEKLAKAIEKAIHPDPQKRFPSAGALAAALEDADRASSRRKALWILIPAAAALVVASLMAPAFLQRYWSGGGAHASYLVAQDALDHYYRPGNTEKAVELFEKTISEDPRFALAHGGLARAYFPTLLAA